MFLFETDGRLAQTGGHIRFDDLSAFRQNTGSPDIVYDLSAPYIIETISGNKTIYIDINAPADMFNGFSGTEANPHVLNAGENNTQDSRAILIGGRPITPEKDLIYTMVIEPDSDNQANLNLSIIVNPWNGVDVDVTL